MEAALTVRMSVRPPAKFTEKTDGVSGSPVSRGMLKRRRLVAVRGAADYAGNEVNMATTARRRSKVGRDNSGRVAVETLVSCVCWQAEPSRLEEHATQRNGSRKGESEREGEWSARDMRKWERSEKGDPKKEKAEGEDCPLLKIGARPM
ncbi:hypothetical protein EMCRGX_G029046 [Ephydatia muelleri]